MNNRSLIYTTIAVIGAILILMMANVFSYLWNPNPETYIGHNQVRGSAVLHQGKLYTLNFDQQNAFIDLLNRSLIVSKNDRTFAKKPTFDKIILYLFDGKPEMTITPILINEDDNYTFFIPDLKPNKWFIDISGGALHRLLSETYD